MSSAEPSFRYRWYARGDVNGFFALTVDNMALLVAMSGILVGVFGMPTDVVLGRMVPGTAFGVLVGDLLYTWLAFRLARRERRQDVCAMPLGIDTPSLFALSFGVVGPAYVATGDANRAWAIGMAVMVIMGVAKLGAAFFGDALRRALPRAALLGALSAVAVGLIMFFPFVKIFTEPIGGMVALGVILVTLVGKVKLPYHLPAVVVSVLAGLAAYVIARELGYAPPPQQQGTPAGTLALPWPTLAFVDGLSTAWHYVPLAIPVAIATVIGGIDNTESAAVAGDRYSTRSILLVEGASTLIAAVCGGVIQNTPYIGHPAYKDMGSRAGYTLATGIFVGIGAATGVDRDTDRLAARVRRRAGADIRRAGDGGAGDGDDSAAAHEGGCAGADSGDGESREYRARQPHRRGEGRRRGAASIGAAWPHRGRDARQRVHRHRDAVVGVAHLRHRSPAARRGGARGGGGAADPRRADAFALCRRASLRSVAGGGASAGVRAGDSVRAHRIALRRPVDAPVTGGPAENDREDRGA